MNSKIIFACICSITIGVLGGTLAVHEKYKDELDFGKNYDEVIDTYNYLKSNYPMNKVNDKRMTQNIISGMIDGLDDRYCYYSTSEEISLGYVNSAPSTVDSGFAIERDTKTKLIKIVKVDAGSQAEKMGLCVNDLIEAVDGVKVEKDNFEKTSEMLLGKNGTHMNLEIVRENERLTIDFVRVHNGESSEYIEKNVLLNDIGYLRFDSFSEFSEANIQNFPNLMDELGDIKGLILDMRNNVGGVSQNSIGIFDYFADGGSELRFEGNINGYSNKYTTTDGFIYDMPVVVLTSDVTCSSAEILAALFQSTGRGTIVGTTTAGKGVYQMNEYLPDGTIIYLVEGYYYVNDVPNYNGVGITPDIVIKMDNELIGTDEDIQLKKAIELLS